MLGDEKTLDERKGTLQKLLGDSDKTIEYFINLPVIDLLAILRRIGTGIEIGQGKKLFMEMLLTARYTDAQIQATKKLMFVVSENGNRGGIVLVESMGR